MKRLPDRYGVLTSLDPRESISDIIEYADDTVFLDSSPTKALSHLNALENEASKVGLSINYSKTKYISNSDHLSHNKLEAKIERVQDYVYLGSHIISSKTDVEARIGKAWAIFWEMKKIWRAKNIPLPLKTKIFSQTCVPILLYGSETWTITKKLEKKINTFAMKAYRIILNISWKDKVRNEDVLKLIKKNLLYETLKTRQINYIKNIRDSPGESILKNYYLYCPEFGKTKLGRPPASYLNYIDDIVVD